MTYTLHKDGLRFISELLAGSGRKINVMYIEYGTHADGPRSLAYFHGLERQDGKGYVRVPVTHSYVDDDNQVHFNALLCREDLSADAPDNLTVVCATLASADGTGPMGDTLICTVPFNVPVPVLSGIYTSIHTSMKLGA